jgi:hypothetical protein
MRRLAPLCLSLACAVSSCASLARTTLEDRFQAIGIPEKTALCMVDDLDQRLSDDDIQDLARYTLNVARQPSTIDAVRALMRIENPRAVAAVGKSAVACVTGLRL